MLCHLEQSWLAWVQAVAGRNMGPWCPSACRSASTAVCPFLYQLYRQRGSAVHHRGSTTLRSDGHCLSQAPWFTVRISPLNVSHPSRLRAGQFQLSKLSVSWKVYDLLVLRDRVSSPFHIVILQNLLRALTNHFFEEYTKEYHTRKNCLLIQECVPFGIFQTDHRFALTSFVSSEPCTFCSRVFWRDSNEEEDVRDQEERQAREGCPFRAIQQMTTV